MSTFYGATREEWEAFSTLNLPDLYPYIADPSVRMHPSSKIKQAGTKVPSFVHDSGMGMGIPGWQDPQRTTTSVLDWVTDPRHGIIMRLLRIKAIDIDIVDTEYADEIEQFILDFLDLDYLPIRDKENNGKRALLYRTDEELSHKNVAHLEQGIIEFLGERQCLAVAGMHPDQVRYQWPEGIPGSIDEIPFVELPQVIDLYRALIDKYAPSGWYREWKSKSIRVTRSKSDDDYANDPIVKYLTEHDWVLGWSDNGGIHVRCPWEAEHTTNGNGTDVEFFPKGSNTISEPGFACQHGHCKHRNVGDFLEATGYNKAQIESEFQPLDIRPSPRPAFTYKGKSQLIEANMSNLTKMLQWAEGSGYKFQYDQFKDAVIYQMNGDPNVHVVDDDTYTQIRIHLPTCGMEHAISKEMVRDAVSYVAKENAIDSAQEWLKSLEWDGVKRLDNFHCKVLKLKDTSYNKAVCDYMWTALAGRVMDPGCKADMVPILIGKQGTRKSTFVSVLAPSPDEFTIVNLQERDADLSRRLRGRIAVEWGELRGLNTRDHESIKDWVSRTKDDWVPKFREFATTLLRRFLVIGTSNEKRMLGDPTGLRRWLPTICQAVIDTEYVEKNRNLLWAEAYQMWQEHGIMWQQAESLAREAQRAATVRDVWVDPISQWLQSGQDGFTTIEVLHQACSLTTAQANRSIQERVNRVLMYLGYEEEPDGRWYSTLA